MKIVWIFCFSSLFLATVYGAILKKSSDSETGLIKNVMKSNRKPALNVGDEEDILVEDAEEGLEAAAVALDPLKADSEVDEEAEEDTEDADDNELENAVDDVLVGIIDDEEETAIDDEEVEAADSAEEVDEIEDEDLVNIEAIGLENVARGVDDELDLPKVATLKKKLRNKNVRLPLELEAAGDDAIIPKKISKSVAGLNPEEVIGAAIEAEQEATAEVRKSAKKAENVIEGLGGNAIVEVEAEVPELLDGVGGILGGLGHALEDTIKGAEDSLKDTIGVL